jgi:putative Mn2+ efflux pump MntP
MMSFLEILLIALSLSADCFAVSISSGGTMKYINIRHIFRMAFFFGVFQAIMPVIGFFLGLNLINYISKIDHWIAFIILVAIGTKMIYESKKIDELNCNENRGCPFGFKTLIILAVATSVDALAIGFTFSLIKTSILLPVIIIGAISFIMSIAGNAIGYTGKHFFENRMETIAGVILVLLGFKTLISHII